MNKHILRHSKQPGRGTGRLLFYRNFATKNFAVQNFVIFLILSGYRKFFLQKNFINAKLSCIILRNNYGAQHLKSSEKRKE